MKHLLRIIFSLIFVLSILGCPITPEPTPTSNDISGTAKFTTSGGDTTHDVKIAAYYTNLAMTTVLNSNAVNLGKSPGVSVAFTITINFDAITNPQTNEMIGLFMWEDLDDNNQKNGAEVSISVQPDTGCAVFGTAVMASLSYQGGMWFILKDSSAVPFSTANKTGAKVKSGAPL
jgi:hypothetical protein